MKNGLIAICLFATSLFANEPFEQDSVNASKSISQAPLRVVKVEWKKGRLQALRFENPRELEDDALWALLDWAGGEAGWIEIDFNGYLTPELAKRIAGAKQAWFRKAPGAANVVATLKGKVSATIEFFVAPAGKEVKQPLECKYQGDVGAFRDFSPRNSELCAIDKGGKCLFVHGEDARLTAEATKNSVAMLLNAPDSEPFPVVAHFAQLSDAQKEESVQEYRSYFQHELNMAVRSFVETTPGLFNWQVWQWMEWGTDFLVSNQEIRALLESGQRPGRIELFRGTCKDGRKLRIWSNGQGTMGMQLQ